MLPHFPRPPLRSHTVGLMFNSLFLRKVSQAYVSRDENGVGDRRHGLEQINGCSRRDRKKLVRALNLENEHQHHTQAAILTSL
jgi:hypothetical protein